MCRCVRTGNGATFVYCSYSSFHIFICSQSIHVSHLHHPKFNTFRIRIIQFNVRALTEWGCFVSEWHVCMHVCVCTLTKIELVERASKQMEGNKVKRSRTKIPIRTICTMIYSSLEPKRTTNQSFIQRECVRACILKGKWFALLSQTVSSLSSHFIFTYEHLFIVSLSCSQQIKSH